MRYRLGNFPRVGHRMIPTIGCEANLESLGDFDFSAIQRIGSEAWFTVYEI